VIYSEKPWLKKFSANEKKYNGQGTCEITGSTASVSDAGFRFSSWRGSMRTPLLFCIASMVLSSLLLLGGCSYQNDGYQNDGYQNDRNQNRRYQNNQSSRQDAYSYSEYNSYYPYGQVNYPRDRIYIIQSYNPCRGNSYRGYCYRYEDDYHRAIDYDRSKGYDDRWYKQQQSYCSTHNCHRDDNDQRDDRHNKEYGHGRQDNDRHDNDKYEHDNDRKNDDWRSNGRNNDNHHRGDDYRDITPASKDGRYDARDRVLDSQQQDPDKVIKRHWGMDNRQEAVRGQGQTIDLPRYQGGEDRLNNPKPETRQEEGASAGIHDNGREHGKRPTRIPPEAMHSEPPVQQEQERPVFVEPSRQERPTSEPPEHRDSHEEVEQPVMREPERPVFVEPPRQERPAFEPPVQREQERPVFVEPPRQERPAFEPPVQREQERPAFVEPPPRQQEPDRRPKQEDIQAPQTSAELPPTEAPAQ
jgi:hypothetical protein